MLAVAPADERTVALERRRLRCDRPVPAYEIGTVIGIVGATAAKATKPG
jgi:hypothetical protein